MASSNRHWPSMVKSKPCNPHHPWQHEINPTPSLMSSGCHTTPYSSAPGCEERTPEPKPRWNPKPEQIRILEAIFNSGMVNPPRDEIRKIRAQQQEYGQVGEANVFYWFQNRKSRSKHKLRHLQNSSKHQHQSQPHTSSRVGFDNIPSLFSIAAPTSSSSSQKFSPDLSAKRTKTALSLSSPNNFLEPSNSPTSSMTQNIYLQAQNDVLSEPFLGLGGVGPHEFCFSDICNLFQVRENSVGPCTSLLLSEIMNPNPPKKMENLNHHHNHLEEKNFLMMMMTNKMQPHQLGYTVAQPTNSVAVTSTMNHVHQGEDKLGSAGAAVRSTTVFISDVPFEVAVGPFNVREAFGDELLLVRSSGEPVLTDEWGFTLQSLQRGALYYLVPLPLSQHIRPSALVPPLQCVPWASRQPRPCSQFSVHSGAPATVPRYGRHVSFFLSSAFLKFS